MHCTSQQVSTIRTEEYMSTNVNPSSDAVARRKKIEQLLPVVAQRAAEHIVGHLEPRFSEAHAEGYDGTFESFVADGRYGYRGVHSNVIDRNWIERNGLTMSYIGELRTMCEPIIKQLLEERYGITANVAVRNGGGPEFVFDWYECVIERPRPPKRPFWQFWKR